MSEISKDTKKADTSKVSTPGLSAADLAAGMAGVAESLTAIVPLPTDTAASKTTPGTKSDTLKGTQLPGVGAVMKAVMEGLNDLSDELQRPLRQFIFGAKPDSSTEPEGAGDILSKFRPEIIDKDGEFSLKYDSAKAAEGAQEMQEWIKTTALSTAEQATTIINSNFIQLADSLKLEHDSTGAGAMQALEAHYKAQANDPEAVSKRQEQKKSLNKSLEDTQKMLEERQKKLRERIINQGSGGS